MTLIFWFLAWAITLLVLGLLLWPLLKRQASSKMEEGEKLGDDSKFQVGEGVRPMEK